MSCFAQAHEGDSNLRPLGYKFKLKVAATGDGLLSVVVMGRRDTVVGLSGMMKGNLIMLED